MCELLGMSANVPTDICFSLTGLVQRGGKTGPHRDGWGIAFYEGKGLRVFHDPEPGVESKIAAFVQKLPIKSETVISHIRKANHGKVELKTPILLFENFGVLIGPLLITGNLKN